MYLTAYDVSTRSYLSGARPVEGLSVAGIQVTCIRQVRPKKSNSARLLRVSRVLRPPLSQHYANGYANVGGRARM